jgi:hypothetical protein
MANDEFELLLERCRERLSEIDLRVPALESRAPRQPVYSLTPPVAPLKPVPAAPPEPAPLAPSKHSPAAPPSEPASAAPPTPTTVESEEEEFFPPLQVRSRIPASSVVLPNAQLDPSPAPAQAAPAPKPAIDGRRRMTPRAAAASAAVAVGMLGVWLARRPSANLDIEVDGADAMTARQDKGDLLVAEGRELLDLSLDGRTLGRRPLDAPVESLHWEQGSLWSADGRTASITERTDAGHTTVFTLNHVPGALYVKDNYLWTMEKDGHTLHQFQISRSILGALLQPIDSFELGGLSAAAFAIDDAGTLWLTDESTRRLHRLHLENGSYQHSSSAPLSPFIGPAGKLRGLSIEKGAVWIMAQAAGPGGRASLRRIALSRLDWTP